MFFKNSKYINNNLGLIKVTALLVHAAKIDENYSAEEDEIIKQTLIKIGAKNENVDEIIKEGKKIEENSSQILDFTKEVKSMDERNKIKIVETLWKIIYSDKKADMYETGLMRKLAGLLYIDNKTMGDIKVKIQKEKIQ